MKRSGLLLICGLLLVAPAARAGDLTIRQRTTTNAAGQSITREETQYAHGDLLVIDAADTRTIVDVVAKTMTVADKAKKTYFVMTFDDMRKQAEAVQFARGEDARRRPQDARGDARERGRRSRSSPPASTRRSPGSTRASRSCPAGRSTDRSGPPTRSSFPTASAGGASSPRARRRRADRRGRSRRRSPGCTGSRSAAR